MGPWGEGTESKIGSWKIWWWREEERGAERNAAAGASENETERQIGHGKETAQRKGAPVQVWLDLPAKRGNIWVGSPVAVLSPACSSLFQLLYFQNKYRYMNADVTRL
jgi:hypothetical protein